MDDKVRKVFETAEAGVAFVRTKEGYYRVAVWGKRTFPLWQFAFYSCEQVAIDVFRKSKCRGDGEDK